jgi:hypothetical protein
LALGLKVGTRLKTRCWALFPWFWDLKILRIGARNIYQYSHEKISMEIGRVLVGMVSKIPTDGNCVGNISMDHDL